MATSLGAVSKKPVRGTFIPRAARPAPNKFLTPGPLVSILERSEPHNRGGCIGTGARNGRDRIAGEKTGMLMTSWLELLSRRVIDRFSAVKSGQMPGSEPWRFPAAGWGSAIPAYAGIAPRRTRNRDPRSAGWNKRQRLG
jgi:hypothetical protein